MSESRQFLTKYVEAAAADGIHTVRTITEALAKEHPDLVEEWLTEERDVMLQSWVGTVLRAARARERRRSGPTVAEIILHPESNKGRSIFDVSEAVNADNERLPLGDMRKSDLLFVAGRYTERSETSALFAVVYQHLSDGVGTKRVRDAFDEGAVREAFGGEA